MKIKIAFTAQEADKARRLLDTLRLAIPGAAVKTSDRHAPYYHFYLETKQPPPGNQ